MAKPNEYTEYAWCGVKYFPAPGTTNLPLVTDSGRKIEYMERTHLEVWVSLNDFLSTTQLLRPDDWDVNEAGDEIVLVRPTREGEYYAVQRVTPFSPYISFADGSQLAAIHLNRFADIDLFRDQELADSLSSLFVEGGSNEYVLPPATDITLGGVIVGSGLTVLPNGRLSVAPATAAVLGGIKVGARLSVTPDGTLSADAAPAYNLPPATTTTLGGVMVGSGLAVTAGGALSATPYVLPTATTTSLGGIKVGTNLTVAGDGTLNAGPSGSDRVLRTGDTMTGNLNMRNNAKIDLENTGGIQLRPSPNHDFLFGYYSGDSSASFGWSTLANGATRIWNNKGALELVSWNNSTTGELGGVIIQGHHFGPDMTWMNRPINLRVPGSQAAIWIRGNDSNIGKIQFDNWDNGYEFGAVTFTSERADLYCRRQAWLRAGTDDGYGHAEVNGGWREWEAVRFSRGGTYLAAVDGNGDYIKKSDLRLKTDIAPLAYGLNAVKALNPISFQYKANISTDPVTFGFIAQEVRSVLPELVREGPEESGGFLSMSETPIISVLVKAVQELAAEVEELKAKLASV